MQNDDILFSYGLGNGMGILPDTAISAASESASNAVQGALQLGAQGMILPSYSSPSYTATTTCWHYKPVLYDGSTPSQAVQSFAFGSTTCTTTYPSVSQFPTTGSSTVLNYATAGDFLVSLMLLISLFVVGFLLLLSLTVGIRTREHIREN